MESNNGRRLALIRCRPDLLRDLTCENWFLDHLVSTRALLPNLRDKIVETKRREEQARLLADELISQPQERVWSPLLAGLRGTRNRTLLSLAEQLEREARRVDIPNQAHRASVGSRAGAMNNSDEEESSINAPIPDTIRPVHRTPGISHSTAHAGSAVPAPGTGYAGHPAGHHYGVPRERSPRMGEPPTTSPTFTAEGQPGTWQQQPTTAYPSFNRPHNPDAYQQSAYSMSFRPRGDPYGATGTTTYSTVRYPPAAQRYYTKGVSFRSLHDLDLERLAERLHSFIGIELRKLISSLLGSMVKYQQGAPEALQRFKAERGLHGDMIALLKMWMTESDQECTGFQFFEALQRVSPGTALQCSELLQIYTR